MSSTSSIDITVNKSDIIKLLNDLVELGWNYNDDGKISYLPLNDTNYDWERVPVDEYENVMSEMRKKEGNNEVIGIALRWKDSDIGGVFNYFFDLRQLSVSLTINRKASKAANGILFTDFTWYLERLVPILVKFEIESIVCKDIF